MQTRTHLGKEICEYPEKYTQVFIKQRLKHSSWNETQLTLLAETFINFINATTNTFMQQGFPGDAVWIFEQLLKINQRSQALDSPYDEDDEILKSEKKPLQEYCSLIGEYAVQPKWLVDIDRDMSTPLQLCGGLYHEALKLDKLQSDEITTDQESEAHKIIDSLLTVAIDTIRKSKPYQLAERSGHLYYSIQKNLSDPTKALDSLATINASRGEFISSKRSLFSPKEKQGELQPERQHGKRAKVESSSASPPKI